MRAFELRRDWDFIKQGLEQIQTRSAELDWVPEDVYMLLKQEVLHGLVWDGTGFILFRDITNPYTQERGVFVFAAYSFNPREGMAAWLEFEDLVKGSAKKFIEMDSTRTGWMRHSGWKEKRTIYRKEV